MSLLDYAYDLSDLKATGAYILELRAEIERLTAWKAEASEVLARWEEVAELVPMQLGDVKSQAVKDHIEFLENELRGFRAWLADPERMQQTR